MKTKIYMQFSNCVTVKGFSRSAVYDLQRNRYILVTNYFADILISNSNKIILGSYDNELKEYLDTLVEEDWGIYTDENVVDLFPKLDLQWDNPSLITNAQLDAKYNENDISGFLNNIFFQLNKVNCRDIQINVVNRIMLNDLFSFLKLFDDTHVNSLTLVIPYLEVTSEEYKKIFETQPRLCSLFFYSSPITSNNSEFKVFHSRDDFKNMRHENNILPEYFTTNIYLFSESQCFNTYYNRKLCIDAEGNIKNDPEHKNNYGNITNTSLKEIANREDFKELWFVNKEKIDVCKDCEFRHMCIDQCIPIQRSDKSWFRSKECNYNPYISKWENEPDYKTLNGCGIICNEEKFQLDLERLAQINKLIWGEDE